MNNKELIIILLRQFANFPPTHMHYFSCADGSAIAYSWARDQRLLEMVDGFTRAYLLFKDQDANCLPYLLSYLAPYMDTLSRQATTPRTAFFLAFSAYNASATTVCAISLLLRTYATCTRLSERKRRRRTDEEEVEDKIHTINLMDI